MQLHRQTAIPPTYALRANAQAPCPPVARAFTLIELLVVVAIIAVLMSILLPTFSQAREQAKTVKCTSNLKQIGLAMQSYFLDTNDWFPFAPRPTTTHPLMHGYYYGGHPGRKLVTKPSEWWGYTNVAWRNTPAGRPLNTYLYPDLPDWDVQPDEPLYEQVRNVPIFRCPSDKGGYWMTDLDEEPWTHSLYDAVGSSYTMNYHFARYWGNLFFPSERARWLHRANAFIKQQLQFDSARFVILYEDPFDSALWNYIPRRGWHNRWNRHSFLFLDGHAANMVADPTNGTRGLGWKTASGKSTSDPRAFWNDPNDPDYRFRYLPPLPGS